MQKERACKRSCAVFFVLESDIEVKHNSTCFPLVIATLLEMDLNQG